ncbi:MAG: Crp/Fnr family transcriptional regulator [Clostridia bacterium]|nr:Crp/Fnr family transcriptional regulator [Clostridia bacterium]
MYLIEQGISNFFDEFCHTCKKVTTKTFKKNEIITTYIAKRKQLCLLTHGEADLIRYDFNGNKTIVEHYLSNSIFGEIFYNVTTNNELFVEAKVKCEVLFFDYEFIENKCTANCSYHKKVIQTLPNLLLTQINSLNTRIEILSKRTIREKLLTYFNIVATKNISKTFALPFSLTDLADYLSVDRSAMMREITYLRNDKIIEKSGNRFTLLY